jgi:hypothetical protein
VARRSPDERTAAVAAALAPYLWRGLTDRMLARRVVGALDRHSLVGFLTALPGTDVGPASPVEPAAPGDERVEVLVHVLEDRPWQEAVLDRLCAELVTALDTWEAERETFHRDLRRLLEEH